MLKSFAKYVLPTELLNLLRRWVIAGRCLATGSLSSSEYWTRTHVDAPADGFTDIAASLAHYDWRNSQYPGTIELMPVSDFDGKIILDYGCGPGNDTIGFGHFSKPARLIAADVSPIALELAKRRANLHGLDVEFIRLTEDPVAIPLPNSSVDAIHTAGVLHHTPDPIAILREFQRILKPDGHIQVMVYNRNSVWMHLLVAWDTMISKGLFRGHSKEEAFARTTDGEACPIARCYRPEEFLAEARAAGLKGTFRGSAMSAFEMTLLPLRWNAIRDKRLDAESRHFLLDLTFDEHGFPRYKGEIAGINGCFRLYHP